MMTRKEQDLTFVSITHRKGHIRDIQKDIPTRALIRRPFERIGEGLPLHHHQLRVFVEKQGLYLQIDTVDPEMLREAKKDPDRFPNLVVRISGWSARFASLSEEWQEMIINRTALEMA